MPTRPVEKPIVRDDLPIYLQRAHARHQDRAASRQLQRAVAKKKWTEAALKRLGLPLED
jgi:hypothetical protein